MNSLVSIIVPNYNREELLKETLDSIISQTYENWEVIVIDDHSSDCSLEVLKQFSQKDSRIQFHRRESLTKGASVCRNEGFKKSRGEFIVFLDSDDLLSSCAIMDRMKAAEHFPDYDFWVFSTLEFNKNPGDSDVLINVLTTEDPLNRFLRLDIIWLATGPFWKRDTINKLGPWDEKLKSGQDWDLNIRALANGFKFLYFNNVDNYWRVDSNNKISNDNSTDEHLSLRIYLFSKIFEFLKIKNQLSNERKKIIHDLFIFYIIEMALNRKFELLKIAINKEKELYPGNWMRQILTYVLIGIYRIGLCRSTLLRLIYYTNNCKSQVKTFREVKYYVLR